MNAIKKRRGKELSATPTSLVSRFSTHDDGHDVANHFSSDVTSISLLSQDILLLPDLSHTNNEFLPNNFRN